MDTVIKLRHTEHQHTPQTELMVYHSIILSSSSALHIQQVTIVTGDYKAFILPGSPSERISIVFLPIVSNASRLPATIPTL